MDQLAFLFRDFVTISRAARTLGLSEQRVRQLADAGEVHCVRDRDGRRYLHQESVKALAVDREVRALMSGRRKTGPKGPRQRVIQAPKPSEVYRREFEAASA